MSLRRRWVYGLGGFALLAALTASGITALVYEKPFYSWPNYRGAGPVFAPVALVIVVIIVGLFRNWLKPKRKEGQRIPRVFRSFRRNT